MIAALNGVVVEYASRRALGPFDLSLTAGEIVALVGPSGCGKSTALRLLAGLESPSAGAVTRRVDRARTSLVFQSPTLMPWASAVANVSLPLDLTHTVGAEAAAQAALDRVGLGDAAHLKPAQLSGGMAMRVALARAIVSRPQLLLLDEPFAALDEVTRRALADDVHRLWAADKPAIVFVTHNFEEAVYLAERIIILSPGPGRAVAEVIVGAPAPRPAGFRQTPRFLKAVEAVSGALSSGMAAA